MSSTTKRKSTAATTTTAKKARFAHTAAAESIEAIVKNPTDFSTPEGEADSDVRKYLLEMALYARSLEDQIQALKPKEKSPEEIQAAADKISTAARSGIRKQMTWKPSCKTGSARFVYDGVCADAAVFGAFLGLEGPPTWKTKKIPKDEFEDLLGDLHVAIRYDTLRITSDINVSWKAAEGTFKCTGSYGK
ncbi:hypothetical protein DXG01_012909 [Tephrocybe rancida]|nr:hypothetical protein DXG01_012909 [Tephrocybe rancida]